MADKLLTKEKPLHIVLREILRHYLEFKQHVANTGDHVIEHSYYIYDDEDPKVGKPVDKRTVSISFWDLHDKLKMLSARKRQAVFYNVILDWKQKDVARVMNITMASVGQYVDQSCKALADEYFKENNRNVEEEEGTG